MRDFTEIKDLLMCHGFIQDEIENSLSKNGRYKATICNSDKVFITVYTPKYKRYLDCHEYITIDELKKYLEFNHPKK